MKYRKLNRWKYQITEPFEHELSFCPNEAIYSEFVSISMPGTIFLRKYYAWDGASGPCPDVRCIMRGSLVHDALYQLMRIGLLDKSFRKAADFELKKMCLEDGMNPFWANMVYWGVQKFAAKGVEPIPESPIYEIP